jgi:hypothetical protein
MGNVKKLTYAEHLALGARVKAAKELLQDIEIRVNNGFGTSSKLAKLSSHIMRKFSLDLCDKLDEVVFRDFRDSADEDLTKLYYGSSKKSKVVLLQTKQD